MISMIDKQTIITLYRVNKLSRQAIARQLHLSRRTITKVIAEYETALQEEDPDGSLEVLLSKPPVYDVGTRKKRVLIPEIIELIHNYMKENERKRSYGLKKQYMLKKDVYDQVVSKGYKVSHQSICRYMYSLEKDKKESGYACGCQGVLWESEKSDECFVTAFCFLPFPFSFLQYSCRLGKRPCGT